MMTGYVLPLSRMTYLAKVKMDAPLEPIPVVFAQNFVFPGGNTFIFKDPGFSEYQDLVSHITFADP